MQEKDTEPEDAEQRAANQRVERATKWPTQRSNVYKRRVRRTDQIRESGSVEARMHTRTKAQLAKHGAAQKHVACSSTCMSLDVCAYMYAGFVSSSINTLGLLPVTVADSSTRKASSGGVPADNTLFLASVDLLCHWPRPHVHVLVFSKHSSMGLFSYTFICMAVRG